MSDISVEKNRGREFIGALEEIRNSVSSKLGSESNPELSRLAAVAWSPPLFIVGCPRSGTTLLQTMLDSHPRLAVTYEADFLVDVPLGLRSSVANAEQALTVAEAHPNFRTYKFDALAAQAVCGELGIEDAAGAMRVLAASDALAQGKTRWGNKTPKAVLHLAELAVVYPDARFIHVITDGRDSAASQMRVFDRSLVQGALLWRTALRAGRLAGSRLGPNRYLEVRLENVIASPEEQVRRMCAFLGEDFAESMLHSHTEAWERVPASVHSIHPRIGEPPRLASRARKNAAPSLVQRVATALIEAELVELDYVPAASMRSRRIVHVIVGYTLFIVSLRRSLPDLFRYFTRSIGAHRAARVVRRRSDGRPYQGGIVPHQAAASTPIEAVGRP